MDVALERLGPRHLDRVAAWLSDSTINRWLTEEWRGRSVAPALVGALMRSPKNQVYVASAGGEDAGIAALANIDAQDGTAMVWYLLGEPSRGRAGLMSTAVASMVDMTFREGKCCSLYAWVFEDNVASAALLRRVGFREAGRIRNAACSAGKRVDRIYFDILPGELRGT
jgi:RimJ/RimL family protein N-acetyltransferase